MLSPSNEKLIRDYLDIAVNATEDLERFSALLADDCVWRIVPPGFSFNGKAQVAAFTGMAMGSRTHDPEYKIQVRNWFADGDNFCVEYFHGAIVTRFHLKVTEIVCLVCHMRDGKFDSVHEYVDTSQSLLIGLGLKLLPLIVRVRSFRDKPTAQ
jgi:ketosteroid isomerase-like protein